MRKLHCDYCDKIIKREKRDVQAEMIIVTNIDIKIKGENSFPIRNKDFCDLDCFIKFLKDK